MLEGEGLLNGRDGVEGCYVWEVEVGEAHVDVRASGLYYLFTRLYIKNSRIDFVEIVVRRI